MEFLILEEALTEQHGLLSMDLLEAQGKIANNKLTIQQLQSELGELSIIYYCYRLNKD